MKLVTVTQLSEMLNVRPKTLYDWVHNKKIPYYKLEGSLRFDIEEVNKWIRSKKRRPRGRVDTL